VQTVHEDAATLADPDIQQVMAELPSWGWAYGQTPEFSFAPSRAFSWGTVVRASTLPAVPARVSCGGQTASLTSKHGLITACQLVLDGAPAADSMQAALDGLSTALVGQRYAFLDLAALEAARPGAEQQSVHDDVLQWLEGEMTD
jgi:lipoate-protein ligase A